MRQFFDKFWHRTLKRPYRLSRTIDSGQGSPVVFLHGLGRSGGVWQHAVEQLEGLKFRAVAFDLLGFGIAPKPDWANYDVDDHARAVIASIKALHVHEPLILVGHSMGCLVAVRVARLRPELVRHLVLYEMPLYEGLPEKRHYRARLSVYRSLYKRIVAFEPEFTPEKARRMQRLAVRFGGLTVTKQTWEPFKRSLANTIMHQTAADDIKHIAVPMDVIYGRRDMLVIRGKPIKIFGVDAGERMTAHTINVAHAITLSASKFIAERIRAALEHSPDDAKT